MKNKQTTNTFNPKLVMESVKRQLTFQIYVVPEVHFENLVEKPKFGKFSKTTYQTNSTDVQKFDF